MSKLEFFQVSIDTLHRNRMVRVYLPTDYFNSKQKFDVLYMHDGHNLFDPKTSAYGKIWNVHQTLDVILQQFNRSLIVVGIDCDSKYRLNEYSPWSMEASFFKKKKDLSGVVGGEGKLYLEWLVNTLIPEINNRYKTSYVNYMAGSSMGGLISLYAGLTYPSVFSKIGCFSSAFWFSPNHLKTLIRNTLPTNLSIYLDVGSKETKNLFENYFYVHDSKVILRLLRKQGFHNLKFIIEKGANHSEEAWARRFPGFVKWLLQI
ncbi:MAG: alpha/beta hydrolase [Bacilli bacterium]